MCPSTIRGRRTVNTVGIPRSVKRTKHAVLERRTKRESRLELPDMLQERNQHPRLGKTERDRKSGAWQRHLGNKIAKQRYNQALALAFKQGNRGRELQPPL